ncbi:HD domain-containing phosphohydrolase [Kosmotoga pacifica]|uniref:HD domain-containing phosphohydrolase n=1 Tax=Kosmotoga pacifica TaxID=1330330 RepID=UPI00069AA09B|nr:HD domain-containing phosphohydrolase [Kosmotoga pacifica]
MQRRLKRTESGTSVTKKSVNMYIKIIFYSTIISIFLIAVLILTVELLELNVKNQKEFLENLLKKNTVLEKVDALHSLYDTYGERAYTMPAYVETVSDLAEELGSLEKHFTEFSVPFSSEEMISLVKANNEYLQIALAFGKIEDNVMEWISKKEQFISKVNSTSLRIALIVFAAIGFVILVVGKYFKKFTDYVYVGIEDLNSFINRGKVELHPCPPIREAEEVHKTVKRMIQEFEFDQKVLSLEVAGTLEDIMPKIFETLNEYMDIDRAAFAFLDNFGNVIAETAVSKVGETYLKEGFASNIKNTSLEKLLKSRESRIINDLEYHYNNIHKSEATKLLLKEGMRSSITIPIFANGNCIGFFFVNSVKKGAFSEKEVLRINRFVNLIKGIAFSSYINQELIAKATRAFADLVEKKDNETGKHLTRVSLYSYLIASKLAQKDKSITPKFVREMLWFSPVHDIGKVGIPDHILLKPAKLTHDEFEIMKTHVTIGEKIIDSMNKSLKEKVGLDFLKTAKEVIMGHHEKWDGSGYPRGLKGKEIPLAGRITAVVDVFDALTSKRSYKPAFSFEKSLEIMREGRGTHFDPFVFDTFIESLDEIKVIYEKLKDTDKDLKTFKTE